MAKQLVSSYRSQVIQYTGWILLFYAITHLLNHAMGIFGLTTLEAARDIFIGFWRLPILEWVVVTSVTLHLLAVLHKLFTKNTFKGMRTIEWVQIVLGVMGLIGLVHHIMETKITSKVFGTIDSYSHYIFWMPPFYIWVMLSTMIIVWCHGGIGMHQYLKLKAWYPRWKSWILGVLVAIPAFAISGLINAQQEVSVLARNADWRNAMLAESNPDGINLWQWEQSWSNIFVISLLLFLLLFFMTRKLVRHLQTKRSGVNISYLEGDVVKAIKGTTLLEASLQADIPHAHVCGGRGRCSTCRVQIISGHEKLPHPTDSEAMLLEKIGGGKAVRLACQTRPSADVTIHPLLLPSVSLHQSLWKKSKYSGIDRDVAILFADLRGFTRMSEHKLPYDVVFVLNQYFQFMGHSVEAHDGKIDKFIGDAIMAVFGTNCSIEQACRQAIAAARDMRLQLDRLNNQLGEELAQPLKMGFGLHSGRVIIGEMGYKESNNLVAIGDATNTASRLESLTKEYNCEIIISEALAAHSELNFHGFPQQETILRGRENAISFYPIEEVRSLDNLTLLKVST